MRHTLYIFNLYMFFDFCSLSYFHQDPHNEMIISKRALKELQERDFYPEKKSKFKEKYFGDKHT